MASGKQALLLWCQRTTEGYREVKVTNFTTSWADGLAFCAIIHKHRPEALNYDVLEKGNAERNLTIAFETAAQLGITPLLDVEDMFIGGGPEPLSVITYLSTYYHHFSGSRGAGVATISAAPAASSTQVPPPPISASTTSRRVSTEKEQRRNSRKEEMRKQIAKHSENLEKARKDLMAKIEDKEKAKAASSAEGGERIVVSKDRTTTTKPLPQPPPKKVTGAPPPEPPRPAAYQPTRPPLLTLPSASTQVCACGEVFQQGSKFCTSCGKAPPTTPTTTATSPRKLLPILHARPHTQEQEKPLSFRIEEFSVDEMASSSYPVYPQGQPPALPPHPQQPQLPQQHQQPPPLPPHPQPQPQATRPTPPRPPLPDSAKLRYSAYTQAPPPALPPKPVLSSSAPALPPKPHLQQPQQPQQQPPQIQPHIQSEKRYTVMTEKPSSRLLEGYLFKKGDLGVVKLWKKRWFALKKQRLFYYMEQPGVSAQEKQRAKEEEKQKKQKEKEEKGGSSIMAGVMDRSRSLTESLITMSSKATSAVAGGGEATASQETSVAMGYISLLDVDSVEELPGVEFGFCLRTTERIWQLHAESEESRRFWMEGLGEEIMYLRSVTPDYVDKPAFRGSDIKVKDILKKQGYLLKYGMFGWTERWFVLKDGILFHSKNKASGQPEKVPLYHSEVKDYPDKEHAFQLRYSKTHTIIIQAHTAIEMEEWCEAILKQTIVIEELIDSIM